MPLLILLVAAVLAAIALMPFSLVMRFRRGASRQRARGWLAVVNIVGFAMSSVVILVSAAVTSIWVPGALTYAVAGLASGLLLGLVGLGLTRWEGAPDSLYYTPSVWLTFAITSLVAARVLYGLWRAWHSWRAGFEGGTWVIATGVAGSLAAGAVVLGYYLSYWVGVRRRFSTTVWARRH